MTAREAAFISLKKFENRSIYTNIEADNTIKKYKLEGPDRALYTAVFYGVVEKQITLDYFLGQLSSRPVGHMDENVRIILRMGLYQLKYFDRVPAYAVLDSSARLARRFAANSSVAFVNAVLREYTRRPQSLTLPDAGSDPMNRMYRLSILSSIPLWLCNSLRQAYGEQKAEAIVHALTQPPKMTLRTNTLKTETPTLLSALSAHDISVSRSALCKDGIRLTHPIPISEIYGFHEGLWFVQDEASQVCAEVLEPEPGMSVLDACACPGGKSFALAMLMKDRGRIFSCDLHENKLSLVRTGAEKLGIHILETGQRDGAAFAPELESTFDRVLCDVPCSGYGVLAKKPEIRHKSPEDSERLPKIQYRILENCARYVKPGGILVYSTCTLNPYENEYNVRKFLLAESDSFEPVPFTVGGVQADGGMLTLFPDTFGCDGFFIAKMRKHGG